MALEFKKIRTGTRLMNPLKDFQQDIIPLEIRFDPLTGRTGRVFDLPYSPPDRPDIEKLVQRSREIFCPFCPGSIEKSTPLFPEDLVPEGRIRVGESILLPNLLPLDTYAAVGVISEEHFIDIDQFDPDTVSRALFAARRFINLVMKKDRSTKYSYINWNYMPPAGSSMVHPHIQVNCGAVATNEHRMQIEACSSYSEENGSDFWSEFADEERRLQERYLGRKGRTEWFMNFVPQGSLPDFWCLFDGVGIESLEEDALSDFSWALSRLFQYFRSINVYSFNMALFCSRSDKGFRTNARLCPRLLTRAIGNSDRTYMHTLHREACSVWMPEKVCPEVRRFLVA